MSHKLCCPLLSLGAPLVSASVHSSGRSVGRPPRKKRICLSTLLTLGLASICSRSLLSSCAPFSLYKICRLLLSESRLRSSRSLTRPLIRSLWIRTAIPVRAVVYPSDEGVAAPHTRPTLQGPARRSCQSRSLFAYPPERRLERATCRADLLLLRCRSTSGVGIFPGHGFQPLYRIRRLR